MRIVVTGSEGFIGKHLVRALVNAGHEVIGLDIKSGQDVRTCELPDADIVYHLAAQTDATCTDAWADADVNVMGMLRLLLHYQTAMVFVSSAMVSYPVTPYAIAKFAGEMYCKIYGASVVRLCNIHGPGGHSVIDRFAQDEVLTVYGSGRQSREYAHVDAAVAMMMEEIRERRTLRLLQGERLSVLDVLARHPDKERRFVPARQFDPVLA